MNQSFEDLTVYKKAFSLAMEIFEISKSFPKEERYSLTDQIRRSSRSVCTSIAEGYRKRDYSRHFVSKSSDADMENSETQVWLHFSLECCYIEQLKHDELFEKSEEVGKLLNHMIENPEKYLSKKRKLKGVE
ncbi:MAG TPA: four helix bundle protein [Cyclobacteriaceae bacterium]|jgi:four helix bundle protein|nr:four helix bundle protein [Cyclobacteriaceae bacterium]